ncbi:MAG: family deacetylase [Chitinophagaceae bacterium]|nr:family deacetylase [Chitinophagaceae bacterium]
MVAAVTTVSLDPLIPHSLVAAKKIKVVCVGGHPDDPETGCGGTLARLAAEGNDVTIIYLTSGEAGIDGVSHRDAAAIRTKEAKAASEMLHAKPVFAGQIDGDTIVNNEWIRKVDELIGAEKPDIVFTHWPIDSHKDHQAASLLTIQSWMRSGKSFDLYFFEVCSGSQTTGFRPDTYVDISATQAQKRKSVYCHTSQQPDEIYKSSGCNHEMMEKFRGIEINATAAEAFVRMEGASLLKSINK